MEFWDTRFSLAARKGAEKLKKYLDEILRHSLFIGCEETSRKFKKYLDEILRHSLLIGCEETAIAKKYPGEKSTEEAQGIGYLHNAKLSTEPKYRKWHEVFRPVLWSRRHHCLPHLSTGLEVTLFCNRSFDAEIDSNLKKKQKIVRHSVLVGEKETSGKI